MKKILLTLAAIFAIGTLASGQTYIGGSIGVSTTSGKSKALNGVETAADKNFGIGISPNIGYSFNDSFSLGAKLGINYGKITIGDNLDWLSTTTFGITPYMRYAFLTLGKFKVNIEAGFGLAFGSQKVKDQPSNEKTSTSNFSIYAVPVLTYGLTKNITLETTLNFCNLGYYSNTTKFKVGDDTGKVNSNGFALGVDTANVISSGVDIDNGDVIDSALITVGFTYKF